MNTFETLLDLIDRSSIMHLGTCSPEGSPLSTRVVGGYADLAAHQITIFIPQKRSDRVLLNLERNSKLAILFIDPLTYRSLQVKGLHVQTLEGNTREYHIQDLYFLRMKRHSFPEKYYQIDRKPMLSLKVQITEVYDQTPGPGAGILMKPMLEGR